MEKTKPRESRGAQETPRKERIGPRPTKVDRDPEHGYQIRYNRHPLRKNNFKVGEMYDCYKDGMSLATIAKLYSCTRQAVYDVFRSRGFPLRRKKLKGARIIAGVRYTYDGQGYLRGTKAGRRVYAHKEIWKAANGEIPATHVLHFKDDDKENVAIENLELVEKSKMHKVFKKLSTPATSSD